VVLGQNSRIFDENLPAAHGLCGLAAVDKGLPVATGLKRGSYELAHFSGSRSDPLALPLLIGSYQVKPSEKTCYRSCRMKKNLQTVMVEEAEFYPELRVLDTQPNGQSHAPVQFTVMDARPESLVLGWDSRAERLHTSEGKA
jgi:hypothetical protein